MFADGSGELFGTVRALDEFTGALAANDAAVSRFMGDLGAVSQQLADEKDELAAALSNLAGVLGKVERFVRDNRELLIKDVENLTRILGVLAGERDALETVLDIGPAAMGNLAHRLRPRVRDHRLPPRTSRATSRTSTTSCASWSATATPLGRAGLRAVQGAARAVRGPARAPDRRLRARRGRAGQTRRSGTATAQPARSLSELLGGAA